MEKISSRVDIAFKKIFGVEENKDLLISLINSVVSAEDQVTEVTLLNPYNPKNFRKDKLSILDIKATNQDGVSPLISKFKSAMRPITIKVPYITGQSSTRSNYKQPKTIRHFARPLAFTSSILPLFFRLINTTMSSTSGRKKAGCSTLKI